MKDERPNRSITRSWRSSTLSALSLLLTAACSSSEKVADEGPAATSSATASADGIGDAPSSTPSAGGGEAGTAGGEPPAIGAGGDTAAPVAAGPSAGGSTMGGVGGGAVVVGGGGIGGGGGGGGPGVVDVTVGGASNASGGTAAGVGGGAGESAGVARSGVGGAGAGMDSVTLTESTYEFRHFPIEVNSEYVWNGAATPAAAPTSTTYDTVILENGYLRVTVLPSYGGRVLSIVHKPTNRELLYQNPIGTPYLMGEDIFYYNYLVIMGGIFPSFPEPEHGKYWNQPYAFEIVNESAGAVTVRMSRQDDLDLAAGVPERYVVGRTDVLVELEVTLRAGRSNLELATKLTNTRGESVPEFEFWTVTTLAPGSTPGDTAIPLNTRILANMDRVHLLESSWAWFGTAEERVMDEVFLWNNLSQFANWEDQGTAFANPSYQANWSGLFNQDADMGILRASDNVETPGLKLWTFGKQSLDIDLDDGTEWLRPTIEMWHGITPEFWVRGTFAANEVRQWSDSYFPNLGVEDVTAASEYGAVHLARSDSGADAVLSATTTLTLPNQTVHAILRLDDEVIAEQDVVVAAAEATTVEVTVPSAELPVGATFEAEFVQAGVTLLTGQLAL